MSIEKLGFNSWFQNKVDPSKCADFAISRVIAVDKNRYVVSDGENTAGAEITGKLMFNADSPMDYPAVGDWVYVQFFNDDSFAVIHEIMPRKTVLKRKTAGKRIEFQLIAANIDTALIMQSLDADFNIRRLERYLVMVHEGGIRPLVLLSKSDLLTPAEIEKKQTDIHEVMPDIQIVAFSNMSEHGLMTVKALLRSGETYCLLGSSGVGKTTLLNNLLHEELFATQEVREKDGKGRHVTARRQLILLDNGSMVIDTPGMRELGNIEVQDGLTDTFSEIAGLAEQCRFNDCTHTREVGCAVLAAVQNGDIPHERYQNYLKMKKESAHYEMSYLEKRRKDKQFGKLVKSVMKHKKNRR